MFKNDCMFITSLLYNLYYPLIDVCVKFYEHQQCCQVVCIYNGFRKLQELIVSESLLSHMVR